MLKTSTCILLIMCVIYSGCIDKTGKSQPETSVVRRELITNITRYDIHASDPNYFELGYTIDGKDHTIHIFTRDKIFSKEQSYSWILAYEDIMELESILIIGKEIRNRHSNTREFIDTRIIAYTVKQ